MSEVEMFYGHKALLIRVGKAVMLDSYWRLRIREMFIKNGHGDPIPIVQEFKGSVPVEPTKRTVGINWKGPPRYLLDQATCLGIRGAERE